MRFFADSSAPGRRSCRAWLPYDEINAEHWLHDIHGVIDLLRPAARRKRSTFRGDDPLATATAYTFQHRDVARTLERWHLEGLDDDRISL